jgi:signal peptidase I
MESENRPAPSLPRPEPLYAGARLRPSLGVWLRDLIVSLAISAFIIVFIYQPVKVEGTSMMPSLEADFAGRRSGISVSARSLEKLH